MRILPLGQKLRRLRKDKGLTLETLGGDFVSKAHLSIIENGKASPSIDLLKYLSKKLEVDLELLLETEKNQAIRYCNLWLEEMEVKIRLGKLKDAQMLYDEIQEIALEYDLLDILGESSILLSQIFINIREYDLGLSYIQKSIYYSIKGNNILRVVKGYIKEGDTYILTKKYDISIQKYLQGLSFYSELTYDDLRLKSKILHKLSFCYNKINNNEKALEFIEEACRVDKIINNPKIHIEKLIDYSRTCMLNREYDRAEKVLNNALSLLDDNEQKYNEALIEKNLGKVYLRNGNYEKGYKHLLISKRLEEENGMQELPETLFELYRYFIKKNQIEKAFEQLGHAIRFCDDMKLIEYKKEGLNLYINYYLEQQRYEEAAEKLLELVDIFSMEGKRDSKLSSVYLRLGNTFSLLGKSEEAIQYFKKGYSLISAE